MESTPKDTVLSAIMVALAILSGMAHGAPTCSPQVSLNTFQRRDDCPPCWDGTRSGCKPESYVTKQDSDTQTSLYYTCTSEDRLTTYYTCDGGCYGAGVCDNGQLYEHYAYDFVVPVGAEAGCAWTAEG